MTHSTAMVARALTILALTSACGGGGKSNGGGGGKTPDPPPDLAKILDAFKPKKKDQPNDSVSSSGNGASTGSPVPVHASTVTTWTQGSGAADAVPDGYTVYLDLSRTNPGPDGLGNGCPWDNFIWPGGCLDSPQPEYGQPFFFGKLDFTDAPSNVYDVSVVLIANNAIGNTADGVTKAPRAEGIAQGFHLDEAGTTLTITLSGPAPVAALAVHLAAKSALRPDRPVCEVQGFEYGDFCYGGSTGPTVTCAGTFKGKPYTAHGCEGAILYAQLAKQACAESPDMKESEFAKALKCTEALPPGADSNP